LVYNPTLQPATERRVKMDFSRDPFLLPSCQCGGLTRLSHVEPHPVDEGQSLRTYVCQACGSDQTLTFVKPNVPPALMPLSTL
jgi:hypothetical protein